jgi:hypothetical protein
VRGRSGKSGGPRIAALCNKIVMMLGEIWKHSAPIERPMHSLQVVLLTAGGSASSPSVVSCHFHLKNARAFSSAV